MDWREEVGGSARKQAVIQLTPCPEGWRVAWFWVDGEVVVERLMAWALVGRFDPYTGHYTEVAGISLDREEGKPGPVAFIRNAERWAVYVPPGEDTESYREGAMRGMEGERRVEEAERRLFGAER